MPSRRDDMLSRARQAVRKWIDRLAASWRRREAGWNPFRHLTGAPGLKDIQRLLKMEDYWGAASTLRQHVAAELPGRFFAGVFDADLPRYLADRLGETRQRVLAQAETILARQFDVLGYKGLTFGDPVDWHLDPVARRRVPLVHWTSLDPSDVTVCGDSRIIWHLNRHQWLVTLGEAYRLTHDEKYAERFDETIRDWIRVNPAGMGINWASTSEVAYRVIAWCWGLALFWPASVLTADLLALIMDELRLHAEHTERYLSYGGAPNWPLTIQALALLYAGVVFRELTAAERWRRTGLAILNKQIFHEVSSDGICVEPASSHQRRLLEAYLHFLILADRQSLPVGQDVRDRVQVLVDALVGLRRPDGFMLRVGEPDGDWVLPLLSRDTDDWRALFAVAAVVFDNGRYAWAAGEEAPELLWILGTAGAHRFNSLTPEPPQEAPSQECARAGYVQMRSGWDRHSHQLMLEVGTETGALEEETGDLLGVQCSVFGEPVVIDLQLTGQAGHREWQEFVRHSSTHSTILVDGVPPLQRQGPLRKGTRAVLRQWSRNERFELADASHDGYRSLAQPVVHRRRVLFVKQAYWVLIDDVQGRGRHRVELVFHLASRSVELNASLWAKVWTPNGPGLAIKPFAGVSLRGELKEDAREGGVSRPGAAALVYRCEHEVPIRLVTLLYPLRDRQTALPSVRPFVDEQGTLSGLMLDDPAATILYSDHSVTVEAA